MTRYIDADVAYKLIQEQLDDIEITGAFSQGMSKAFNIAKSILHNQEQVPTADVQEVIYCKNCKNYCKFANGDVVCEEFGGYIKDNDFCSRGERKDGKD